MSEKRYRIAGADSDLASEYPDVAKTLSIAGRNMSGFCYGCMALFIRCLGFCPESRKEVKEMNDLLKTINNHKVKPWIISSPNLPFMTDTDATIGFPSSDHPSIGWSDPDMEEEFF